MSVFFEIDITGTTIGYKLSMDAGEAAYAIKELARHADESFPDEVAEFLEWDADLAVTFLRRLADAIAAKAVD